MRSFLLLFATLSTFFTSLSCEAAIVVYGNRGTWQTAAGPADYVEDFEFFTEDTSFRIAAGPLSLNGFSVQESGVTNSANVNKIDTAPFEFSGTDSLDGDAYLFGVTNHGLTYIDLYFDNPTSSFAADFRGADGVEHLNIEVIDTMNQVLATLDPVTDTITFLGFVANGGEQIARLRFFSSVFVGGVEREAFGMDNVALVNASNPTVPEPTSAVLLITLLGGFAFRQWRKRAAHGADAAESCSAE
jgi:hypothetical protein